MTIEQQDKLKKQHERKLEPKLLSIFRRMTRDLKAKYIAEQQLIMPKDYEDEFRVAIKERIRLVSRDFKDIYRKSINRSRKQVDEEIDTMINEAIMFLVEENTQLITATSEEQLRQQLQDVILELGADATPQAIADALAVKFLTQGTVRSSIISEMLVQQSAESTKEIEVEALISTGVIASLIAEGTIEREPMKTWNTIIDGRQREAHGLADGQTVPVDESFTVGGEQLRFPADPRGSIGNIARCRCSVTYS